ncbi:hypothetical protein Xen7305DRAFT_00037480 [Xenococcus sp. PCC 7305]|nr:hypothetical protein Xen7305DRAFT_00037480 [Xenococcus sp. PCC 7305]
MNIIKILSIEKFILAVYYTPPGSFKYSIVDKHGVVFEPYEIYYSSEAAEREGKKTINIASS